jgi:hypothetical protein
VGVPFAFQGPKPGQPEWNRTTRTEIEGAPPILLKLTLLLALIVAGLKSAMNRFASRTFRLLISR